MKKKGNAHRAKKRTTKKGPMLSKTSYHCGNIQTNVYKGVTYCNKCHREV